MRSLSQIVPDYAEQVDFYLVAFNENVAKLEAYILDAGYSEMTAAQPVGNMLRDLEIVSQSSMLALDPDGIIQFRKGYGLADAADLRHQFAQLAGQ